MNLIDTHAHLYLEQFEEDRPKMIQRAKAAGVRQALLPNIDRGTIAALDDMVQQHPGFCIPMMGLHPCSVKADYRQELKAIETHLEQGNYCAVGEIGLDFYWDKTYKAEQETAFLKQVAWAKERGLPIAIHCRDSFERVVELLQPLQDRTLRGVFHCFTGNLEDAQKVIDLGFYMSIGGVVTFKNSGLDKVIEQLELKHLLLETDAPYLAPAPHRGKRNESAYVRLVAEKIAEIHRITVAEVADITARNARALFALPELS